MNEPGTKRGGGGPRLVTFALALLFWLVAQAANFALHAPVYRIPGIDGARPLHAEEASFAVVSAAFALGVVAVERLTRATGRVGRVTTALLVLLSALAPLVVLGSQGRRAAEAPASAPERVFDVPTLAQAFHGVLPRWCGEMNDMAAQAEYPPAALRCTFDKTGSVRQGIVSTTLLVGDLHPSLTRICRKEQADKWSSCHFLLAPETIDAARDVPAKTSSPGIADEHWPENQALAMGDSLQATFDATHGWWVVTSSADAGTKRAWVFDAFTLEPAARDLLASDLPSGTSWPHEWLVWFAPLAIAAAFFWRRCLQAEKQIARIDRGSDVAEAASPSAYRHAEPDPAALEGSETARAAERIRWMQTLQRARSVCLALAVVGVAPFALAWTWHAAETPRAPWRTGGTGHLHMHDNPCPQSMRLVEGGALHIGEAPPTTGVDPFCFDASQTSVASYRAYVPRNDDVLHSSMFRGSCHDPAEYASDGKNCLFREQAAAFCRAKNLRLPTTDEDRFALMLAASERKQRALDLWTNGPSDTLTFVPHRACEYGCPYELTVDDVVSVDCPDGLCAAGGFPTSERQLYERIATTGFRCAY